MFVIEEGIRFTQLGVDVLINGGGQDSAAMFAKPYRIVCAATEKGNPKRRLNDDHFSTTLCTELFGKLQTERYRTRPKAGEKRKPVFTSLCAGPIIYIMKSQIKKVSVIGQGKVGSTMIACFASKGYQVTGVDIDPELVEHVNRHRAVFQEPHVQEFMTAHRDRISATVSVEEAVVSSDITFIIVPTPSLPSGGFSAKYVCDACTEIGKALAKKKSWHLVVVTSTVLPGTTENEIVPTLEKAAGKKCGVDFDFCYSPLFIALGNVAMNILKPDFVLVGESSARAGETLEKFYRSVVDNQATVQRMNFVNAELSKITVNVYVTTKISFAN
jgi:UDPglucose 6-dehydrogenase